MPLVAIINDQQRADQHDRCAASLHGGPALVRPSFEVIKTPPSLFGDPSEACPYLLRLF